MNEIEFYYECTSLENFKLESDDSFTIEGFFLKVSFDKIGNPVINNEEILKYEFDNLVNGYVSMHHYPSLPGEKAKPIQYVFRFETQNTYIFISFKDIFLKESLIISIQNPMIEYFLGGKFLVATNKIGYIENKLEFENNFK